MGLYMYLKPPKKIGPFGYRTGSSMESQERLDFAQKYAGIKMANWNSLLLLVAIPGYFIDMHPELGTGIAILLLLVTTITPIILTEPARSRNFKN